MERKDDSGARKQALLHTLSCLPEKIVATHGLDGISQLVLYELAHPDCFNFKKAAFFVENPDFQHLQGIVGIAADEHPAPLDVWQNRDLFLKQMERSPFHKQIRGLHVPLTADGRARAALTEQLGLRAHAFNLKHGNKGILLFEPNGGHTPSLEDLNAGLSLLAFCPIF